MIRATNGSRPLADGVTERPEDIPAASIDPYWNHVARTALMYGIPVFLSGWIINERWIVTSRDLWVPLVLTYLTLAPVTKLKVGRPLAYKDYQNRDRFIATYGLLPAGVWIAALHSLGDPAVSAAAFALFVIIYDALLLRFQLLCVYAHGSKAKAGGVAGALTHFSVPFWGYIAIALWASHVWGNDSVGAISLNVALALLPPVAVWWLWRTRWAPPVTFSGFRNIAVVGGGWSGIYATKWLSEAGFNVTCFEASESVGGIWKYRADKPGGTHAATRVTSSKHFLHACDYPMPLSTPEFPHRSQVLQYLESYVSHFGIGGQFRFNARVSNVNKEHGKWRVQVRGAGDEPYEENFDAIVISSGPHQNPNIDYASHPLYSSFTGEIIHSSEYKQASDIAGDRKTILVVGAGESSADIVTECVNEGASVHWSVRSGQWFADRNMGPYPADHITTQGTRVFMGLFGFWEYLVRRFVTGAFVNLAWGRGGHGIPEWLPDTPYLHQFLNKSRDAVLEVYSTKVKPHKGISRISGKEVFFVGENTPLIVDAIILATGFRAQWPFLREAATELYKLVFSHRDPTCAFVGFARPIVGSIPSLAELQARWVAAVWSGATTLPAPGPRAAERHLDEMHHRRLIRDGSKLGILVEQELYATDVASRFNAHVHWFKLLLTWPNAFAVLLISPWAPFKYRLNSDDPEQRRNALADTVRELPGARAPIYLLVAGIVVTALFMLGVAAFVVLTLSIGRALTVLAAGGLILSCLLRLTETRLSRNETRPATIVSRLREVFPF